MSVGRYNPGSTGLRWDRAADLEKEPAEVPDPETTDVPEALREEIEAHMAKGSYIADLIATLAMLDPILGGIDR